MAKKGIGVTEILDKLKNEFSAIEKASEKMQKGYGFDVEEIELELQFAVTKGGKAGVNLMIVEAGGKYDKQEIQTIRIKLNPYKLEEESTGKAKNYEDWKEKGGYNKKPKLPITLKRKAAAKRKASPKRKTAKRR